MKTALVLSLFIFTTLLSRAQAVVEDQNEYKIIYKCPPCGCDDDDKHFESMGVCPSCDMALRAEYTGFQLKPTAVRQLTVGMLIFEGADIMDITGPWSVFEHNGVNVVTFAKSLDPVRIGMSLEIKPDFSLKSLPKMDILVFPGSGLAESNPGDAAIKSFIQNRVNTTEVMFSVCSGAFFLAEAGVLDGNRATTFASLIPRLESNYPNVSVINNVKYTDNGKVVTSAGLSSGIDAAFHVVSKFRGQGDVQDVANHMEYPWAKSTDYARSQLADNFINGVKSIVEILSDKYISSRGDMAFWEYKYLLSDKITAEKVLKLLNKELSKIPEWTLDNSNVDALSGVMLLEKLGKARVNIKSNSQPEGDVVTITAKRL